LVNIEKLVQAQLGLIRSVMLNKYLLAKKTKSKLELEMIFLHDNNERGMGPTLSVVTYLSASETFLNQRS